jgi:hypothetical protein
MQESLKKLRTCIHRAKLLDLRKNLLQIEKKSLLCARKARIFDEELRNIYRKGDS